MNWGRWKITQYWIDLKITYHSSAACLPLIASRVTASAPHTLQLAWKSGGSFSKSTGTVRNITRARLKQCSSSFRELSILFAPSKKNVTHTHTHTHRSQEGGRKSIREPSPFTFISHLFLIPPPFLSFLFPLALPHCYFTSSKCVWSLFPINQWMVCGEVWKT